MTVGIQFDPEPGGLTPMPGGRSLLAQSLGNIPVRPSVSILFTAAQIIGKNRSSRRSKMWVLAGVQCGDLKRFLLFFPPLQGTFRHVVVSTTNMFS